MENIKKNIYEDIVELSDLTLQRKLWLNENNDTGLISSFEELYCRLFDDNDFEKFAESSAIKMGLNRKTITELKKLKDLLNRYEEKETPVKIIEDPEWHKITQQAKIVLKTWNKG